MQNRQIQIPKAEFQPHNAGNRFLAAFDSKLYRFFLLNWHRRARKTTHILNLLIRECCRNTKAVYLYVAPTYKQAKNIIWRDPNMLDKYLPQECVTKKQETELFVEFDTKSILAIRGGDDPDSLRGMDYEGIGVDEFALLKPQVWEEILRPVIAQKNERWAAFAFTPKGLNHAWDYWNESRKWKGWYRDELRASTSGLIPKDEIDRAKVELPSDIFEQEFECKFLSEGLGVFKRINDCIAGQLEEPKAGFSYIFGLDLAHTGDFNVITVICRETKQVVCLERWNGTSWNLTVERAKAIAQKYNNALCVPDRTGVGDPIVEDLQRAGIGIYHDIDEKPGVLFTSPKKIMLIEKLMVAIEHRLITYPELDVLIDELRAFSYELMPGGKFRYNAPEGKHDDCVISLALAVWALLGGVYDKYVPEKPKTSSDLFWDRVRRDTDRYNQMISPEGVLRYIGEDGGHVV